MKHSPLIFAVVLFSSMAMAAERDWKVRCDGISDLAEQIMGARQEGIAMSKVIKLAKDDLSERMIIAAYEEPRYSTPSVQKRQVDDFRDTWYLSCVRAYKRK